MRDIGGVGVIVEADYLIITRLWTRRRRGSRPPRDLRFRPDGPARSNRCYPRTVPRRHGTRLRCKNRRVPGLCAEHKPPLPGQSGCARRRWFAPPEWEHLRPAKRGRSATAVHLRLLAHVETPAAAPAFPAGARSHAKSDVSAGTLPGSVFPERSRPNTRGINSHARW